MFGQLLARNVARKSFWSVSKTFLPSYSPIFLLRSYSSNTAKKKKPISSLDGFRRSTNNQETVNKILKLVNKSDDYTTDNSNELNQYLKFVTSTTISDSIDFNTLCKTFDSLKPTASNYKIIIPDEVIHLKVNTNKDLIILSNGTIIGWNFDEQELIRFLPQIKVQDTINEKYDFESDEFDYVELLELPNSPKNNGNSYMINDIIIIQGINQERRLLDKIAFSIGLSRSTRLSILENNLEEFLKMTKLNSINLSTGNKITTTESEVLKLTGKLFLLRGKLNLYNELIDTPDVYWSEPTLEKIYQMISTNLDINSRISILNRKLDYATEEQRAFLSLLNEKKSTKLEWTIIILILIEVGFETYRFVQE